MRGWVAADVRMWLLAMRAPMRAPSLHPLPRPHTACPPVRRGAAAALQYGIERDFTNRTENVLLYDLGAGSVEAALVRYSAYPDKKV